MIKSLRHRRLLPKSANRRFGTPRMVYTYWHWFMCPLFAGVAQTDEPVAVDNEEARSEWPWLPTEWKMWKDRCRP